MDRTNEELVALIQAGDRDKLFDLWQQTKGIAFRLANRMPWNSATEEDIAQAAFLGLVVAADSYSPVAKASFVTWFYQCVRKELQIATGTYSDKQRRDPLHKCLSADVPVSDTECLTLGETICDGRAEDAFAEVDRRIYNEQLKGALMNVIDALAPCQREAVITRYWGDKSKGWNPNLHRAMENLRGPRLSRRLRKQLQL